MEDVRESGLSGLAGVVRGEVREVDGAPVAGARVVVTASPVPVPDFAAVTDAEGRFALTTPVPGKYALTIHVEGAPGRSAAVAVTVPSPAGQERAAAPPRPDPDADVGSETEYVDAPRPAAAEVHLVITLGSGIEPSP